MKEVNSKLEKIQEGKLYSVLDLDMLLAKQLKKKVSKEDLNEINEIKKKRIYQKEKNKEWGNERRIITNKLKKIPLEKENYKKIDILNKNYNKIPRYNLKYLDNDIKRLLNKDFKITVDDGFNKPYLVKSTDLIKDKTVMSKILKKMRNEVEIQSNLGIYEKRESVLKNKVIPKIDFNNSVLRLGEINEDTHGYKELEDETDPPIIVDMTGDVISLI